ncbi:MAG: anthranilate synthase component 1 [Allosphingosinicella sp.]|uniref:anthranilate synthase component 1 n=1 Tax=Allosphingosinicella sp. TaxID=2823234 RepID=UPI003921DCD1
MIKRHALVRPLGSVPDALALHLHLTGGRADTMFFERPDAPSLLMIGAALRLECRGQEVRLRAFGAVGTDLLANVADAFPDRITDCRPGEARLTFPRLDSADPQERLTASSAFDLVRFLTAPAAVADKDPFVRVCLGVVAFDHVDLLEDLPAYAADPLGFPDLLFWLPEELIVVEPDGSARLIVSHAGDEEAARKRLEALLVKCADAPPLPVHAGPAQPQFDDVDLDDRAYEEVVRAAKAHILAGDVYQIVPSRTFRARCPDSAAAFAAQRDLDPSPYRFYVSAPDHVLFGCSPETGVRVTAARGAALEVEVKPIAGTRRRGATADEDDRLEAELRLDEKELAEHMMLVDLARNDVARVSERGSRRVAELLSVERYARVMHLVSSVRGRLAEALDSVHALQACLNVGTLSGAPKLRAITLLRGLERGRRGAYGGAVGWLNGAGEMDTGIVIRSAVVKDGTAHVRAGAGVVHDSNPAAEAEETRSKAAALLSVLAGVAQR